MFFFTDGTLGLQAQCMMILLRDGGNGECTVKPRDMGEAIMSELDDGDGDGEKTFLAIARYVNYDWEDARDRNLRDGRESYFRSRWLTINIVIIKKVVNI